MAKTSVDDGRNSTPGGPGTSTPVLLGQSQASSNEWLGISERVADGTTGSRPETSHGTYGGERDGGELFKGNSAGIDGSTAKQLNAGGSELNSAASSQYGPGSPNYLSGGVASRENMTIGGGQNRGKYVGDGVGSTPEATPTEYINSGAKTQMGSGTLIAGTAEARTQMARAERGLGKRYPRNDSKNQSS